MVLSADEKAFEHKNPEITGKNPLSVIYPVRRYWVAQMSLNPSFGWNFFPKRR